MTWFEGKRDLAPSVSDSLIDWLGQILVETGILTLEAERDQARMEVKGYKGWATKPGGDGRHCKPVTQ